MRKVLFLCVCVATVFAVHAAAQCPTIVVKCPAGITNPGENVVFRAEINVVGPKLEFRWSVDKGTIIEGQGTTKIAVFTEPYAGEAITATVTIDGLPETCQRTASETAGIAERIPCGLPVDEWGDRMKLNDQRSRLDVFFAELANNPKDIGVIVFRVGPNEKLDPRNSRVKFVLRHIKFREFDKSRFLFFLEPSEERSTRFYRMPPGADPPPCEACLVFKGEHS